MLDEERGFCISGDLSQIGFDTGQGVSIEGEFCQLVITIIPTI